MNGPQPSIAAMILDAITCAPDAIDTTQIYAAVEAAENITIVSVTCRDLLLAGKVQRVMLHGRWHYSPRQLDLLAPAALPAVVEDLPRAVAPPIPATRNRAHTLGGRRVAPGVDRTLKLRTLDKLIALLADDIASVLRAVRHDVENIA